MQQKKTHSPLQGVRKTFQKDGHWIEKTHKTPILLCTCGTRYLKTRHGQNKCLRCFLSS
jgi:hypothetical protein